MSAMVDEWLAAAVAGGLLEPVDEDVHDALARVFAWSDFVRTSAQRRPEYLAGLLASGQVHQAYATGEMGRQLSEWLAEVTDEVGLERRLRQFRHTQMLRIVWRDLARSAGLDETLEDLSELADVCIQHALRHLTEWTKAQYGTPRDDDGKEQGLIVLGMGKLGARELNMSSDIDLIFCFPQHGQTDGRRPIANEEFFVRLGRKLICTLSKHTADGFVFRVDMRLRPFGDSGPLVASYEALETYYYSQAREWERYAMVKARAIAGDTEEIGHLMTMLRAFVYRRYIDFGAIEAIRDMKRMIQREMHKKGMDANIKLGRGGIREIEFIGQVFQLVRGGRDPELQIRPIQQVLRRLAGKQLLPDTAVAELTEAYRFLRLTENRIQAWRDEQTHLLPGDAAGRARLAASMGCADWPQLASTLIHHRQCVQNHFDQVFQTPLAERQAEDSVLAAVWRGKRDAEALQVLLETAGFTQADQSLAALTAFREGPAVRTLSARAREKLDCLMPMLLEACTSGINPDITLQRLLGLLSAIVRRTAYLDLLVENPPALSQLVRLVGESLFVVAQLTRQPILLDELLDPRRLYAPLHRQQLTDELETLLGNLGGDDLEQEMERLRQFSQGNRLRVAAADIAGVIPLMVVSDYLTEIAEVTLGRVQRTSWRDLRARHGVPGQLPDKMDSGFAIIGYGKLGGIELGYGSDLDLLFLHGSDNPMAMTDGKRSIANDVFYARLGQRIIHMLSTRTPSGQLYEIDMRLRPNGNSGMLVSALTAFEKYQHNEAWTWEHQALIRARAVAGDPAVIERFNTIRTAVLCDERDPDKLRADVLDMRQKMRDSLDKSTADGFHIKQGAGGLVDIEFLVQYAVLRWAHEVPELARWTDNARLLETLARHRLLEGRSAELLWNAYQVFRAVTHRVALQDDSSVVPAEQLSEERAMVRDIWGQVLQTD